MGNYVRNWTQTWARDRSALIAFHIKEQSSAPPRMRGGAVPRNALYGHRRVLPPPRAAPSSIVFDDFIGLAFQRGIGATRPAVGVCRSVERTCDGHAVVARLWRRTTVRD